MDEREAREFGRTFQQFLERVVHAVGELPGGSVPLADEVEGFLGRPSHDLPVVTEVFRPFEHATVQVALDALLARDGVGSRLVGIAGGGREHHSLSDLVVMSRRHAAFGIGAVDHTSVPIGVEQELTCVRLGLYLIDDGTDRLAVLLRAAAPESGRPAALEVMSASAGAAERWLAELRAERLARNVLRGQVLSFEPSDFEPGAGPVRFHRRPDVRREDLVLPPGVLERVERQVVGVARHRERLRAEGRHLKRGVLLYGPPGTGKTHTVRYLTGDLREFTVVLLAGPAIRFVAEACALARTLQPALVVLEDCDLVAEDRSFSPFGNPLLFTVLDEMDGLEADADVAFLLTTNRADLLEPALAQRPGRVDLAAEVPLPDEDGRRRLLALYARGLELAADDVDRLVARTDRVPASFVKELVRRATLVAADRGSPVTGPEHLHAAAEELLAAQEALTRHLLAGGPAGEDTPGPGLDHDDPSSGWFAAVPGPATVHRPGWPGA